MIISTKHFNVSVMHKWLLILMHITERDTKMIQNIGKIEYAGQQFGIKIIEEKLTQFIESGMQTEPHNKSKNGNNNLEKWGLVVNGKTIEYQTDWCKSDETMTKIPPCPNCGSTKYAITDCLKCDDCDQTLRPIPRKDDL